MHTTGAKKDGYPAFTIASQVGAESTVVFQAAHEIAGSQIGRSQRREGKAANEHHEQFLKGDRCYEKERQSLLNEALRNPVKYFALVNRFLPADVQDHIRAGQRLEDHDELSLVCTCPSTALSDRKAMEFRTNSTVNNDDEGFLPRPAAARRSNPEGTSSLLPCCFLSGASVLGASALHVQPGDKVLDLCAGPGAKALLLASMLFAPSSEANTPTDPLELPEGGLLVCNEPVKARATVLEDLLASFLPDHLLAKGGRVIITKAEASHNVPLTLQRLGPFDKVLVDAPCTASRGRGGSAADNSETQPKEIKANSELQDELLRCAASLVRPGGLITYSTTSLWDRENDEAVHKFLKRFGDEFKCESGADDSPISGAERTKFGTLVLPDQGTQHGPVYFAQLRRLN